MRTKQTIISLFEEIVRNHPAKEALKFKDYSLSYCSLNHKANQLARHLQARGVQKQEIVALEASRSLEWIIGILAILKVGAVYLPIDINYPAERKQFMLDDANPKLILSCEEIAKSLEYPSENLSIAIAPSDLAYINYTSGTTGKPKGVEICHRGVVRLVKSTNWVDISPDDRFLHLSNPSFDASVYEIWGALLNGAALCIYPQTELSIPELGKILVDEKITHFDCSCRVFNLFAESGLDYLQGVRVLTVGGDVMSAPHAQIVHAALPSCRLFNTYGPTENTCLTTVYEISDAAAIEKTVPIGRPIDQTTVYLLDESLKQVAPGVAGELYTGGEGLARGYLNRPDLTAEKFIQNPYGPGRLYKTGDLATFLPDGNLAFLGRVDHQVKINGYRIEIEEIENAIRRQAKVSDCAVNAVIKSMGCKALAAYIEPKKGLSLSQEEVQEHLSAILPDYMLPGFYLILETLPLTPHGKVDRKALPCPLKIQEKRTLDAPETEKEKALASIWMGILNRSDVGRNDDFFLLGGDSVHTVQLAVEVKNAFGCDVPIHFIAEHSTLKSYAENIGEPQKDPEAFSAWRDREAVLDPAIVSPHFPKPEQYRCPKNIFLTGATGFVGAFFLRELLEKTDAQIFCHVRAKSSQDGSLRLKKTLEKYRIWKSAYAQRIIAVPGDLGMPLLGIDPLRFNALSLSLESIFHIGAAVNHVLPYQRLKAENVLGTEEALRLAACGKPKPFHYISTVDVLENQLHEDAPLSESNNLSTGYAQSKWVGEKLVQEARSRGLAANIYRLSRVSGDTRTGSGPTNDFLWRMIQACLRLEAAPHVDYREELTPVDFIAQAILHISRKEEMINHQYHVLDPELYSYADLFSHLERLGYSSPLTHVKKWRKKLIDSAIKTGEPALRALSSMFSKQGFGNSVSFKNCRLAKGLKGSGIDCPKLEEDLFQKYIDYYVDIGFLPAAS